MREKPCAALRYLGIALHEDLGSSSRAESMTGQLHLGPARPAAQGWAGGAKGCVVPCQGSILHHSASPEPWAKGTLGSPLSRVPFVTFFATLYGGAFLLSRFFCSVSVLERETWRLFKSDNSLSKQNLCPAVYWVFLNTSSEELHYTSSLSIF